MNRFLNLAACFAVSITAALSWSKPIIVAADGTGDFKTVQEAIAAVPDASDGRTVIHIKPGIYQGQIVVPAKKSRIEFEGDDASQTVLTYALNQQDPLPAGVNPMYRGTGVVVLGDDFEANNITFQNTSGDHGQALALRIDGDRAVVKNCRLLGWQDTLMLNKGRMYFGNCFIAGRVDFIYGSATAVFDRCELHSKNGGHVTAASTPRDHPWGFVFMNCELTGDAIPWVPSPATQPAKVTPLADLGRPWRPYASVTWLNCEMGDHIRPSGWNNWRNPANEKTARYAEFNSTGPGANPAERVAWSRQLTADEAAKLTIPNILGGSDGWNPAEPADATQASTGSSK